MEMKMSRNILAMVAFVFLLPAFLIGTYAQQADTKAEPKTKPDRSRTAMLQILQEAVRSADALKDARSKAMMLVAVATGRAKTGEQASGSSGLPAGSSGRRCDSGPVEQGLHPGRHCGGSV